MLILPSREALAGQRSCLRPLTRLDLDQDQPAARQLICRLVKQPADAIQPVGPTIQRQRRLVSVHVQLVEGFARDVRRIRADQVERTRDAAQQVSLLQPDPPRHPMPLGIPLRHLQGLQGDVGGDLLQVGDGGSQADGDAARPGSHVCAFPP